MKSVTFFLFSCLFITNIWASDVSSQTAADAVNNLSVDLYKNIANDEKDNIFFSPYSVSSALVSIYTGAAGDTAKEMGRVLYFRRGQTIYKSFKALNDSITQTDKNEDVDLVSAVSLWLDRSLSVKDTFLDFLKNNYQTDAELIDFKTDSESARRGINTWAYDRTKGYVNDLIKEPFREPPKLVLATAIYFKGKWEKTFDKALTKKMEFYFGDGTDSFIDVDMMYQKGSFRYAEDDVCQILEMPYLGGLSMMVFLPKAKDGLPVLQERLSYEYIALFALQMPAQEIKVYFPRFKSAVSYNLSQGLSSMGMPLAFSDGADFSGIAQEGLKIDDILHQAYIEVDEEGTVAAAATAVTMRPLAYSPEKEPKVFRADHPFIFVIKENSTGAILFMGRYVKPE